jgi:Tol biopolymer transport system component
MLAVVALVVLAIAAATLYVGSQRRLPAPFGPAANGLIVYATPTDPSWVDKTDYQRPQGDILTIDPVTGASSVLVDGPTVDGYPVVSLDGTRVAFIREVGGGQMLYVVDIAGGEPTALTDDPLPQINDAAWSPDGTTIAFTAVEGDISSLWMARSDGRDAHRVDLDAELSFALPQWRPPDGDELLLVGSTSTAEALLPQYGYHDLYGAFEDPTASDIGLFLVRPDGSDLRPITPTTGGRYDYGLVTWTPDGTRILTQAADERGRVKVRILAADGTPLGRIEPKTGDETVSPIVSPDGKRVAYADIIEHGQWTLRIEQIDGSSDPIETGASFEGQAATFRWSPDGETLIVTHHYDKQTWLFDADGGPGQPATWTDPGSNAWQRVAP